MEWFGRLLRPFRPGVDALTSNKLGRSIPSGIAVTSPVFKESEAIPSRYTVDGDGQFPGIAWEGLPAETKSVVLLVEDADIPLVVPVTHLIVHSIDPALPGLGTGAVPPFMPGPAPSGWSCGRNFLGAAGWTPPAPPPGHGEHRYAFQVFALDAPVTFRHPPRRGRLMRRIRPHIIARGSLVGTYSKS
ncbi:MAG: YbhB/YbcL family Raf kinase inhibitor-like protein [Acetobacteraceae bacterium]|nr:YbhB/YbcL family Raf kinase inhibitor-like protein [Acetobacteraceae bacterium]